MCSDSEDYNALQEALENASGLLAQNILQLCIQSDESGLLYSQQINTLLQQLIKMGLDLKPYLNSNIPYHQVEEQYGFGTYVTDPTYQIAFSNKSSLIEVLLYTDSIISQCQPDESPSCCLKLKTALCGCCQREQENIP